MLSIVSHIKKYKRIYLNVLIIIAIPFIIPILSILTQIIFSFGNYVGTIARLLSENICNW